MSSNSEHHGDKVQGDKTERNQIKGDNIEVNQIFADKVFIGSTEDGKNQKTQQKPAFNPRSNISTPAIKQIPQNFAYPDEVFNSAPNILPRSPDTIPILIIIHVCSLIIFMFIPQLGLFAVIVSIIGTISFFILRSSARKAVINQNKLYYTIHSHWPIWESRIDAELQAKGFVNDDDLKNLAKKLFMEINDTLGLNSEFFFPVLSEYEHRHGDIVVFRYIYDRKSGKPVDYNVHHPGPYYGTRKILALRSKFPPSRYEYSTELRNIAK
jgi:hypothetical protein